jgi:hypothetical protein
MFPDEQCKTVGRLVLEHHECADKRVAVVERIKQIADALKKLAEAINRKPDFDAVAKDGILHEYLDPSKIGALVLEEKQLSDKQMEYCERLKHFGIYAP